MLNTEIEIPSVHDFKEKSCFDYLYSMKYKPHNN